MGNNASRARKLAAGWWSVSIAKKARDRDAAVCDRCASSIPKGGGFLCNPTVISDKTPDMVCKSCFDRLPFDPWDGGYSDLKAGPLKTTEAALNALLPKSERPRTTQRQARPSKKRANTSPEPSPPIARNETIEITGGSGSGIFGSKEKKQAWLMFSIAIACFVLGLAIAPNSKQVDTRRLMLRLTTFGFLISGLVVMIFAAKQMAIIKGKGKMRPMLATGFLLILCPIPFLLLAFQKDRETITYSLKRWIEDEDAHPRFITLFARGWPPSQSDMQSLCDRGVIPKKGKLNIEIISHGLPDDEVKAMAERRANRFARDHVSQRVLKKFDFHPIKNGSVGVSIIGGRRVADKPKHASQSQATLCEMIIGCDFKPNTEDLISLKSLGHIDGTGEVIRNAGLEMDETQAQSIVDGMLETAKPDNLVMIKHEHRFASLGIRKALIVRMWFAHKDTANAPATAKSKQTERSRSQSQVKSCEHCGTTKRLVTTNPEKLVHSYADAIKKVILRCRDCGTYTCFDCAAELEPGPHGFYRINCLKCNSTHVTQPTSG